MSEMSYGISVLLRKYGLGDICGTIEPISGGLMHKMYKVSTESASYAVKCLNPEVMKRPGVLDNYARAEGLESILEKEGIPIVPALSFDGKKMLEADGKYYYIFRWQEGSITDYNAISKQQCYMAGEILGRVHKIDPQNTEPEEPEVSDIDFEAYASEADKEKSVIAGLITDNLLLLKEAQDKLNNARCMLPAMSAIDDPDMDPKNIMWHEDKAYVIDLECLERGNPIASCLNLALQWAGTVNGKYSKENLAVFFEGYLSAYDNGFRSYDELFGISYTWLEWLEYNIRRALGMEGSNEEDIRLGEDEVKNTVGRIKYLRDIEEDVCSVLAGIEAPDPCKYKTHDNMLCYVDLLFEGELQEMPQMDLPEGYRFVKYKPGDKTAWINIELSAEEVLDYKHGEECWERYYGGREDELSERMIFIENSIGEKIATATAFYDIHGDRRPGEGQLHWVAVKKEEQGKGLSKPLITYTLGVMKELGYEKVKIHTQTNTWLACKVYYDLGFRPEKESLVKNRFGWRMVSLLTGRDMQNREGATIQYL